MVYFVKNILLFFLFIQLLVSTKSVQAQNYPCYLYGNVVTIDGDVYRGAIRWNDEEVFLTDVFNAEKEENPYVKYLPKSNQRINKNQKRRKYWDRIEFTFDRDPTSVQGLYARKFQCRFGDIKSISVTGQESVSLELRDGKFINLRGGSNDIGTKVWIIDQELGLLKIDWNRIDVVNFETPPITGIENFGQPIYGKLLTTKGEFTGFVQWDHDERLLSDMLDGKSRDGDIAVSFSKIKTIEKIKDACRLTLHSGRTLNLGGKNDVNSDNRGILLSIPNVGRINFPWSYFRSLELKPFLAKDLSCKKEFRLSERLFGSVLTKNGKLYKGIIVYDLDEAMDSEILNGLNDGLDFSVPFRYVKKIKPMAYNYCLVELKNGESLYLGDKADVSNRNSGVIVFVDEDVYQVFEWEDIKSIVFL